MTVKRIDAALIALDKAVNGIETADICASIVRIDIRTTISVSTFANPWLRYSFTANQKQSAKVLSTLVDHYTKVPSV